MVFLADRPKTGVVGFTSICVVVASGRVVVRPCVWLAVVRAAGAVVGALLL